MKTEDGFRVRILSLYTEKKKRYVAGKILTVSVSFWTEDETSIMDKTFEPQDIALSWCVYDVKDDCVIQLCPTEKEAKDWADVLNQHPSEPLAHANQFEV